MMLHRLLYSGAIALLIALPYIAMALGQDYYVGVASRILIFAIAASSLNLLLGNAGMLSFGHAAYLGIGAYTVAILAHHAETKSVLLGFIAGTTNAWIAWPAAALVSALCAWLIGAISLRTRGVYFIMITLAFAQMFYYLFVSLEAYGGDDGLSLAQRSRFGLGVDLGNDTHFYFVVLVVFLVLTYVLHRMTNARFGHALLGIKINEARMEAIGFATYRFKLVCFVIGGAIAGLAGALLVNHNSFISPNTLHWTQSGTLLIMIIIGGVGHLLGGVAGAAVLLLMEEILSAYTTHWHLALGAVLLGIVFLAPKGLAAAFARKST
jgi:branched-chain amino acid transport system permease protein